MSTLAGGGWALALKVRADAEGPLGSAPVWTARALVNGASLDPEQDENARLAPYFEQPLGAVLVVMEVETGIFPAAVLLKVRGQSLHDLIASGNGYPSTLLRENWFALVGSSDLQPNCGRQGLNVRGSEDLLRIGILGNNENDCTSTDSWLGIGGTDRCGDPGNDVGNGAGLVGPDTCVRARTWVYVRDEDFTFHPPATDCVSHLAQGRFDDGIYLVGSGDRVRCDMTNHGGGWTSVLDFDAASDACPASFVPAFGAEPEVAACGAPPGVTSSSLTLPAPFAYREVMTRTLGYQRGETTAFAGRAGDVSIDDPYVDGASVTAGTPRRHVATFAVGLTCPCRSGAAAPLFAGDAYRCEARTNILDPVFDGFGGAGCGIASSDEGTVVIDLGAASSADLELRLMRDNPNAPDFLFDDEGLALYRAEIYVR